MPRPQDPIDVDLGRSIRTRRRALDLSQAQLGDRIGVSFQQVQKYETAANRVAVAMFCRIAFALDMSPVELLEAVSVRADTGMRFSAAAPSAVHSERSEALAK